MSGSKKQFVPHEQAQITSVKMAGETALSEMMGTWKRLFKNELAALGEEKLAKPVTRTYRLKKLLPVMEAESVGSLAAIRIIEAKAKTGKKKAKAKTRGVGKPPHPGPVLFRYGPLVEVAASLSIAEKREILETLEKGWIRIADKGTWVGDWTLENIEVAEQACYGALTLIEAKLVKLDSHVDEAGYTDQAEAMHSYIADTLHEMEDAIVESVIPRLLEGRALLLKGMSLNPQQPTKGGE